MLQQLYIKNYALIDVLDMEFRSGFSVITGETGAGKSIILGAIGLLLGQRADSKTVKAGADRCIIEAHFDLARYEMEDFFRQNDIDFDPTDTIIRRELTAQGKSRAFINDTPVPLTMLKELGDRLMDVHSQHQNLLLSKHDFQLSVLDIIAQSEKQLTAYQRQCGKNIIYYDRKGRPQELGSISEEPYVEQFKTFGAKKYVTIEEGELRCTIAGVPKRNGAKVIGNIDNFELGLNFPGSETGKLTIWYNPDEGVVLHDEQGRPIRVYANAAMLPCNYLLGISEDFRTCLWYENVTSRWDYEVLPG